VIAFRTDTFYGLGADPFDARAIRKIRLLKAGKEAKPILLLISDDSQVDRFIQQAAFFKLVARKHWPAPLTLIGVARPELPAALTASTHTLGVRLPMTRTCALLCVRVAGALRPPAQMFPDSRRRALRRKSKTISRPELI